MPKPEICLSVCLPVDKGNKIYITYLFVLHLEMEKNLTFPVMVIWLNYSKLEPTKGYDNDSCSPTQTQVHPARHTPDTRRPSCRSSSAANTTSSSLP